MDESCKMDEVGELAFSALRGMGFEHLDLRGKRGVYWSWSYDWAMSMCKRRWVAFV